MLKAFNIFGALIVIWGFVSWLDIIALNGVDYSWNLFEIIVKLF